MKRSFTLSLFIAAVSCFVVVGFVFYAFDLRSLFVQATGSSGAELEARASSSGVDHTPNGVKKLALASVKADRAVATDAPAVGQELRVDRMSEKVNAPLPSSRPPEEPAAQARASSGVEVAPTGMKKLAIATVKVGKAVATDAAAAGRKLKMDRMTENLNAQLLAAFQTSRKFQLVGRQDAAALAEEDAATGQSFAFGEADYLLVVTVDDFQDTMETKAFPALGTTVTSRTLRFAGISAIYDARTKVVVETSNIDVSRTAPEEQRGTTTGDTRDALLRELTKELAEKTAQHVADVVYPARVLARTDKTVTVNRGEGSGIANGQLWEVFALGEEMKDPDTGASLGREEVSVGKIRVIRVTPKTSQATVVEDSGIDRGAIVRRVVP